MTTKILALSLGVAMLSGIGIASADTVALPGGLSEVTTQSKVIELTDKQMDGIAGGKAKSIGGLSPAYNVKSDLIEFKNVNKNVNHKKGTLKVK